MSLHVLIAHPGSQVAVSPVRSLLHPISLFHRIWPAAGLGAGLIVTAAWIAFLVYELFRLAFLDIVAALAGG